MQESQYRKYILPVYVVIVFFLLFARDVLNISLNKFIFVGASVIFMLCSTYLDLVYMFAFTMPLLYGLPNTYIMLITIVMLFIKKPRINAKLVLSLFVFAMLEIIAITGYPQYSWIDIVGYLSALTLFFIYTSGIDDIDPRKCVEMFLVGTSILCGIIIISGIKASPTNWLNAYATGYYRFGNVHVDENSGMTLKINANTLAYHSITGLSMSLVMFRRLRDRTNRSMFIFIVRVILFALAGILSASRSWIYITFIIIMLYAMTQLNSLKGSAKFVASAVIVVFLVYKGIQRIPQLYSGIMMRLERGDLITGNGRIEVFKAYSSAFVHNPKFFFLGTGVTHTNDAVGINKSMHNGLQQIIVCFGIIGAIIFLVTILRPVVKLLRERIPILYWIPLATVILFTQTIQFVNPYNLMFPYAIALYVVMIGRKENEILHFNS